MKGVVIRARWLPKEPPTFEQVLFKLIKQREKVSYKMIKEELKITNEMMIRRTLENLVLMSYVEKERCLCGQGFIWKLSPSYLKSLSKVRKKR